MIDLERLVIKPGDVVKSSQNFFELEPREFIVKEVKIVNMVQMVYPEVGHPVPASELVIVKKFNEVNIADLNRASLTDLLNQIYKDEWDIVPNIEQSTKIESLSTSCNHVLLIHYPEVDLKNSNNTHHLLRDLFVAIPLTETFRIRAGNDIFGTRTTFTTEEQSAHYTHSHLSTYEPFPTFTRFCVGSGVIRESILLCHNIDPSVDIFTYEIFFENLNAYVAWESIEGGPYNRIENINNSNYGQYVGDLSVGIKNLFIKFLRETGYIIPFDLNFNVKSFKDFKNMLGLNKETLKDSIKDHVLENFDSLSKLIKTEHISQIVVHQVDTTQYTVSRSNSYLEIINILSNNKIEEGEIKIQEKGNSKLYFRGEFVKRKVILRKNNIINKSDLSINNHLIEYLIDKFNKQFYGKLFESEDNFKQVIAGNKA